MNTNADYPRFQSVLSLLEQQLKKIINFQNHLQEIKKAITENQLDQLGSLIEATPDFYAVLESVQAQIHKILHELGYTDQSSALDLFIQQHDDDEQQLQQIKTELNQQLTGLEKALLVNDLLIRKNQHRIKQSIKILSGHSLSQVPATYSKEGNTGDESLSKKTLARA